MEDRLNPSPLQFLLTLALLTVIGTAMLAGCSGDGKKNSTPPQAITPTGDAVFGELLQLQLAMPDVRSLAYSPDGSQLALASDDTIWLYTADLVFIRALTGHTHPVRGLAWSPNGTQLASASLDHTVWLWDVTGETPPIILAGHTAWVFAVAWSPDGKQLATGSTDHTVRLWDTISGEQVTVLGATAVEGVSVTLQNATLPSVIIELEAAERILNQTSDATDEQRQAAEKTINKIQARDDATLIAIMRKLKRERYVLAIQIHDAAYIEELSVLNDATLSATFRALGSAGFMTGLTDGTFSLPLELTEDELAGIFEGLENGDLELTVQREALGHENSVTAVTWSPDGTYLASASADSTLRLWDIRAGTLLNTLEGHQDSIIAAAWSPDGTQIASTGWDATIKLWNTSAGMTSIPAPTTLTGHTDRVIALAWSPNSLSLATGGRDGTIRVWDIDGTELALLDGDQAELRALAWSPDGTQLISSATDDTVRVWDVALTQDSVD